jgi:plasmid stabilization system protein ParE
VRIVWSPQSLRDLYAIHESIAKDSEHLAGLTVARIFSAVKRLIQFPHAGRIVPQQMSLKYAKSSLDVFASCTGFEINCLKWQQSLGRQENFRKDSD